MKRVLAAILSLCYLVAANGVAMNLHYCCGRLDKVAFSYTTSISTDYVSGGLRTAYSGNDCCKDVHKQLKVTQSQNTAPDINFPGGHSIVALLPRTSEVPLPYFSSVAKGNFSPHAPPLRETNPVYLKNCSFLI
jgi:hypothetical protein